MTMVSHDRELSIHQEHEVLLKLEKAGLSQERAQAVIDSPDNDLAKKLVGVISGELVVQEPEIPTWTRVRLGGYTDADQLLSDLEARGIRVRCWTRDIAVKIELSGSHELELVAPTVRELGFDEPTRFDRVCERARELGFKLVPQDVALFTALQAADQVERGLYVFASAAITNSDGDPLVFGLGRNPDGGLRLNGDVLVPDGVLILDDRVVFSRCT